MESHYDHILLLCDTFSHELTMITFYNVLMEITLPGRLQHAVTVYLCRFQVVRSVKSECLQWGVHSCIRTVLVN